MSLMNLYPIFGSCTAFYIETYKVKHYKSIQKKPGDMLSDAVPFHTLLPTGPDRAGCSHRYSSRHHGVLVPSEPHCYSTHGSISGLALLGHLPQLLCLEGQP